MRLRVVLMLLLISQGLLFPVAARADSGGVLISEIQIAGKSSASDEFVELYNAGSAPAELKGWKLEYHAASGTDCASGWTTKVTLAAGAIAPHSFFLLSSTDYVAGADGQFNSGLATGGSVRLTDGGGRVLDAVAWGTGKCGKGTAAPVAPAGGSIERRPGADFEHGGNAYDTNDNNADFMVRTTAGPQSSAAPAEEPVGGYVPAPAPEATAAAPLELNELLPDPAAPQTDANDEFIEIFNPNPFDVSLSGYVIKTGANLTTKHTLPAIVAPATGYVAITSAQTKISLSNSGSNVALFDPLGHQVGSTVTYPKAKPGEAWARVDSGWAWSSTATPGTANILSETGDAATGKAATAASKSHASSSKAAAASVKSAKTTKASTTKTTKAVSGAKPAAAQSGGSAPNAYWLLLALAGLTIAYVIYEFRYDLRNYYYRIRGYAGRSQQTSQATPGRGSHRTRERPGRGQDDLRTGAGPWAWLRRRGGQPDVHPQPRV